MELTELPEAEFRAMTSVRVRPSGTAEMVVYSDKMIKFDLKLITRLHRGTGFPDVHPITFKGCQFLNEVEIGPIDSAGQILFYDCLFKAATKIRSLDNVVFSGKNEFENYIEITSDSDRAGIDNFIIRHLMVIKGGASINISNINNSLGSHVGHIDIDSSFDGVYLNTSRLEHFTYRTATEELFVNQCDIQCIHVENLKVKKAFFVIGSAVKQLFIYSDKIVDSTVEIREKSVIGHLKLDIKSCRLFRCIDSTVTTIEIFGSNTPDDRVIVQDTNIGNLYLRDLLNRGYMSFSSIDMQLGGRLQMIHADMGKVNFISCRFDSASFEFKNSKIFEAFMAESEFPKSVSLDRKDDPKQAQLAFGQISVAFGKQGDTVRGLEYQSREIEAHYTSLHWFGPGFGGFSFTKFSLLLNKLSTNFGRNWGWGVVFSFVVGGLFFYFLVLSSTQYYFGWPVHFDPLFIPSFLKFMNPLRFFDTENLFKVNSDQAYLTLSSWSYAWDFISRILVAYGYYQTIQAFRRFGRK